MAWAENLSRALGRGIQHEFCSMPLQDRGVLSLGADDEIFCSLDNGILWSTVTSPRPRSCLIM